MHRACRARSLDHKRLRISRRLAATTTGISDPRRLPRRQTNHLARRQRHPQLQRLLPHILLVVQFEQPAWMTVHDVDRLVNHARQPTLQQDIGVAGYETVQPSLTIVVQQTRRRVVDMESAATSERPTDPTVAPHPPRARSPRGMVPDRFQGPAGNAGKSPELHGPHKPHPALPRSSNALSAYRSRPGNCPVRSRSPGSGDRQCTNSWFENLGKRTELQAHRAVSSDRDAPTSDRRLGLPSA